MISALVVFVGGGLGAVLRYFLGIVATRLVGVDFPWGTLFINITGSLAMGVIVAWLAFSEPVTGGKALRLFLTTGILGGYTTFSTFSLDTFSLWERGEVGAAAGYVAASLIISLAAVAAGAFFGRWVWH